MNFKDANDLFSYSDAEGKGHLTREEFSKLSRDLGFDQAQTNQLFSSVDANRDGKVERDEFIECFKLTSCDHDVTERSESEEADRACSWEELSKQNGHVIFSLSSYEKVCTFYNSLSDQPALHRRFEKTLLCLFSDVEEIQRTVTGLEASLDRATKRSEEQLTLLEEEMETQLRIKEENTRTEERETSERRAREEREKYEREISKLQAVIDKLRKIDDKLSGASPYEREIEKLREKVRKFSETNSSLRMKLNEADTIIAILRSEQSALKLEIQERTLEWKRESEAATMALSEQENMSRHVNSLYSDNKRLRDSNNDLRVALDSNLATFQRMSSKLSLSLPTELSVSDFNRSGSRSGRSSRNSLLEFNALSHCDPGLRMMPCDDIYDDETEIDVSMQSLFEGERAGMSGSCFERDSGLGTTRDEPESEEEAKQERRQISSQSSVIHSRNRTRIKRFPGVDASDCDLSDDDRNMTSEECMRTDCKRKASKLVSSTTSHKFFRVILCGDSNVGKSSFIIRLCRNKFKQHTRSTLGLDFHVTNIQVSEGDVISLQLWDTAGQERFRSIATSYFRKADAVILLYDVTYPDSFINVREWMDKISTSAPSSCITLICANKMDLRVGKIGVLPAEGAQLAANYGVPFMETSAATGENVLSAVTLLARHLVNRTDKAINSPTIQKLEVPEAKSNCC